MHLGVRKPLKVLTISKKPSKNLQQISLANSQRKVTQNVDPKRRIHAALEMCIFMCYRSPVILCCYIVYGHLNTVVASECAFDLKFNFAGKVNVFLVLHLGIRDSDLCRLKTPLHSFVKLKFVTT